MPPVISSPRTSSIARAIPADALPPPMTRTLRNFPRSTLFRSTTRNRRSEVTLTFALISAAGSTASSAYSRASKHNLLASLSASVRPFPMSSEVFLMYIGRRVSSCQAVVIKIRRPVQRPAQKLAGRRLHILEKTALQQVLDSPLGERDALAASG